MRGMHRDVRACTNMVTQNITNASALSSTQISLTKKSRRLLWHSHAQPVDTKLHPAVHRRFSLQCALVASTVKVPHCKRISLVRFTFRMRQPLAVAALELQRQAGPRKLARSNHKCQGKGLTGACAE